MVVVMSPMGDHAPPALAEMITIPAYSQRVSLSAMSFLKRETMTIDVVRLSKTAEKKKVSSAKIHIKMTLLLVLIRSVMTEKPSWASTNSTMVIAPKRKNKIDEISSI